MKIKPHRYERGIGLAYMKLDGVVFWLEDLLNEMEQEQEATRK